MLLSGQLETPQEKDKEIVHITHTPDFQRQSVFRFEGHGSFYSRSINFIILYFTGNPITKDLYSGHFP